MTSAQARTAFDLAQESTTTRERYGMSRFGQCCLLARRLVESGVRFVTINAFLTVFDEITWDIHGSKPFTSIEGMRDIVCPMYDQAYTALVEDLAQRGPARYDARVQPGGVRPHAPREPRRRARSLAALLHGRASPAAAFKEAEWSERAIQSGPSRRTVPSNRPISPRPSSTASVSTSKRSFPGRPAGRFRSSISDTARSRNSSEVMCMRSTCFRSDRGSPSGIAVIRVPGRDLSLAPTALRPADLMPRGRRVYDAEGCRQSPQAVHHEPLIALAPTGRGMG